MNKKCKNPIVKVFVEISSHEGFKLYNKQVYYVRTCTLGGGIVYSSQVGGRVDITIQSNCIIIIQL